MAKRLFQAGVGVCAGFWLAAGWALCVHPLALAQGSGGFAQNESGAAPDGSRADRSADKSSQQPALTIPVEPLGFSAPGPIYLRQRLSLVSLDFLDEDRLLFTFRVPGLIRRQLQAGESEADRNGEERHIRAVVLTLPAGTVQAEALWTLHDRERYLWMLKDGHFLLRDGNDLKQGDASLELKQFLRFAGPLLWVELDPSQQFLVTDSREPASAAPRPGEVPSPATAAATVVSHPEPDNVQPELALRILRRSTGQVMLVSRVRSIIHLPINSDGYLESLRATGTQWLLNLNYFTGGSMLVGRVESTCSPSYDFVSQRLVLVSACTGAGGRWLVAMTADGRRAWDALSPPTQIWPNLTMAPDGSRLARETLTVTHPVSAFAPLSPEDIKGQLVEVYDAASGKVALTVQASPVLDAGGNVAISPSGRRVAVLHAGAIQIYELPAPPPLPEAEGQRKR